MNFKMLTHITFYFKFTLVVIHQDIQRVKLILQVNFLSKIELSTLLTYHYSVQVPQLLGNTSKRMTIQNKEQSSYCLITLKITVQTNSYLVLYFIQSSHLRRMPNCFNTDSQKKGPGTKYIKQCLNFVNIDNITGKSNSFLYNIRPNQN